VLSLVPLAVAAGLWWGFHRLNRRRRWFRTGELVFWDAIALIVVYLLWLRWF